MARTRGEPHPLHGQKIAVVECPGCGRDVDVKVNRNGIAYHNCNLPNIDDDGRCHHQTRYGRAQSNKLIARHVERKEKAHGKSAKESPNPSPETQRERSGGSGGSSGGDGSERERNFLGL